MKDRRLVRRVCEQLGFTVREQGEYVNPYTGRREGQTVKDALIVETNGRTVAVIDPQGNTFADSGYWGTRRQIEQLQQNYGVEKAMEAASMNGYFEVGRTTMQDGTIALTFETV